MIEGSGSGVGSGSIPVPLIRASGSRRPMDPISGFGSATLPAIKKKQFILQKCENLPKKNLTNILLSRV
jgi:hypothetical protein